ncbi:MAG: COX15/CtaA family protein [Bryobacteraceae bacterium]
MRRFSREAFPRYAWSVLGFNLLTILWGALVRASGSGDGCGDHWPLCNGTVFPHAAQIATLIEFTHRATTGIALISVVAMVAWAFRVYPAGRVRKAASASLILILTEALLGAGLVLLGYTGTNASMGRAVYLSAHLVNTLLMIAAMALTAKWGSREPSPPRPIEWNAFWGTTAVRWAGLAILAAILVAISGTIAALSDTLFPSASLQAGWSADFSAASPLFVRLRIWHPAIAAMAGIYIAVFALLVKIPGARRLGLAVAGLVGLQIACGLLNLWLLTPAWMQMIHLLVADLLWIALVLLSAEALESGAVQEPVKIASAFQPL